MNALDLVIIILFIPGIVRGLSKGFLEQGISLVGVVLSVYLAYRLADRAGAFIARYITVQETFLHVLGFIAVLVGVLILVLLIAKLATKIAEMATLGWLNKTLGLVFALATTALVLSILAILFDTVNLRFELVKSPILQESVLYGYLKDLGYVVFPYLKQLFAAKV